MSPTMSGSQLHRETVSANRSRRLTAHGDPVASPMSSASPTIDNTLPYRGTELPKNSLRLLDIEPATHDDGPVVCTLKEVPFGSRPKYEALSYMWGPEEGKDAMILNGHPFHVRKNLRDALIFLRNEVASGNAQPPFWIDAICINQSNRAERNRQLPIMGQIYFRAGTVVVWLGSSYQTFEKRMTNETTSEEDKKPEEHDSSRDKRIQQEMVRCLQKDDYWGRLWIIQEIGRARKLRVCFGTQTLSWERFAQLITMHNGDGNTGPLRLDGLLRKEKYNDSHTLKRLLEDHKAAKCSDVRDKVYGLVGLASDAAEFPMDYKKTPYEVWKDTMVFMNMWGLFKEESQILPVGALVKSLLMENHSEPWSWISPGKEHEDQVDSTQLIEDSDSALVFHLDAIPLGCILGVGPSAREVVSSPHGTTGWSTAIQRLFPAGELGPARKEYDNLVSTLLESNDSDVEKMCFNRPSSVVFWSTAKCNDYRSETVRGCIEQIEKRNNNLTIQFPYTLQQGADKPLTSVQPRLYLAKSYTRDKPSWPKMGVASGLVELRDLVCWVRSSRRALLVRDTSTSAGDGYIEKKARVFGTALVTGDMRRPAPDKDFYTNRWSSLENEKKLKIQVDASTIFTLLE
ncbi:HET-domain-containing protein [Parathielavia appendiculata]|uniref:HET-domain-containing protein n=1 Tax=Parathielavia appendiculata TaxID=2587402 RepID=A0AAN6Z4U8_9PEZI|nr:HET-domain-containing protein [Parathielavia appendiculata]